MGISKIIIIIIKDKVSLYNFKYQAVIFNLYNIVYFL